MTRGVVIQHTTLGTGEIKTIEPRKNQNAQLTIRFSSTTTTSRFNTDAFKSGKITDVVVPIPLFKQFAAWKEQLEGQRLQEDDRARAKAKEEHEEARAKSEESEDLATQIGKPNLELGLFMLPEPDFHDKVATIRREYYGNALPRRIQWLQEWANRIVGGAPGRDPAWSRGNAAATYLRENGLEHLWHFTDVRNLEGIRREGGLLSWFGAHVRGLTEIHMVANDLSRSCDERFGREQFVRLIFIPNSYFFHRVKNGSTLIWLRFSFQALMLGEVFYSLGNAASSAASPHQDLCSMAVDWNVVKPFEGPHSSQKGPTHYPVRYQHDGDDAALFKRLEDSWNSEVLIKHFLPIVFCTGAFDARTGEPLPI